MKRALLCLALGTAGLGHARNPDIDGYLSGDYGFQYQLPSQSAEYQSSLGNRYAESSADLSAYGFDLHWVQPFYDPLSISLGLQYSGLSREFMVTRLTPPSGSESERANASNLQFSTGLRLYSAGLFHDYDPNSDRNPAGRLLWPSLRIQYESSSFDEHNTTTSTSGAFNGFNGAYDLTSQRRALAYRGELPVASSLTLYARYEKELGYSTSIKGPLIVASSGSGDGSLEGIGSGMIIYANDRPGSDGLSPYLPHVGFPGRLRFDINYFQVYGLASGHLLNRVYTVGATYVLANGVGLSLALDQGELSSSQFDQTGYTITQSSMTSRDVYFGLRWGWGKIRKPGAEPQPEAAASVEPVEEKPIELDARKKALELKATRAMKDSLMKPW